MLPSKGRGWCAVSKDADILNYQRELRERLMRTLESEEAKSHPMARVMREQVESGAARITEPCERDYWLPGHFAKTMPARRLSRLRSLLGELWRFRQQLVGLTDDDAKVLFAGDPFALLLRDEFAELIQEHLRARLSKPSVKDRGNPVVTYNRLVDEFVHWLDALTNAPGTGHGVVLADVTTHLDWVLYQETWAPLVTITDDGHIDVDVDDPMMKLYCQLLVSRSNLEKAGNVERLARQHPDVAVDQLPGDPLAELACIAEDLKEFPARLARTFRPEQHILQLGEDAYAAWTWNDRHQAGVILLGATEEDARRQVTTQFMVVPIAIGLDGVPVDLTAPLRRVDSPDVIRWTLGALRPIHEHLFRLWDAVGPRPWEVRGDDHDQDELEAIATAVEALEDDEGDPDEATDSRPRVRVPAVRTNKLLSVLEGHFGCEVSRGKGSEITVFREGGRIYTLPGHKRNTHYPTWMIRALLKTVGIPAREFAEVVSKRVQTW